MLEQQRFLVKQQVSLLSGRADYDIFNPDTQQQVGAARESRGFLKTILTMALAKKKRPRTIEVRDSAGAPVFTIHRPWSLFRTKVRVLDANNQLLGYFKTKLISLSGGFWVYDPQDKQIAEIKGDWKGFNFRFMTPEGKDLGQIGKQWEGMAKGLFTSADTYLVSLTDEASRDRTTKTLLLAASLAVDIVFREGK